MPLLKYLVNIFNSLLLRTKALGKTEREGNKPRAFDTEHRALEYFPLLFTSNKHQSLI